MLTRLELQSEVEAIAANFSFWTAAADPASCINPAWSLWYKECRLCHEPVLNTRNWQQAHWQHHVLAGDIVVDPRLKPGERRIVNA